MIKNRLVLLGDVFFGGDFQADCYLKDSSPFTDIQKIIQNDDIVFANIETTFYSGHQRPFRSPLLKSPIESIRFLKDLNLDVACLANNHIMDYGTKSMLRTKSILYKNGITSFGAGIDLKQSLEPAIIERKGQKFGFIGFTSSAYHVNAVIAGWCKSGSPPLKRRLIEKQVKKLKTNCDFVCVALHWGHEYTLVPTKQQRKLAKKIIEAGADLIIGTHPHIIQGYERIHGKYVFYSLGNFFFPEFETILGKMHHWPEESQFSLVPILEISEKQVKLNVEFTRYEKQFLTLMKAGEKIKFLQKQTDLNTALKPESMHPFILESNIYVANNKKKYFKSRPKLFIKNILFLLTYIKFFRFIDGIRIKNSLRKNKSHG